MTSYAILSEGPVADPEDIGPLDLRAECAEDRDAPWVYAQAETVDAETGARSAERISVLYNPPNQRAGVCWGGDSDWTDADSVADAIERYLGIDGKEMCN